MPSYVRADDRLEVRLPRELRCEVASLAQREGESLASLIRRAIRRLLDEEARREEHAP